MKYNFCPGCKKMAPFAERGIGKRDRKDWRCMECRLKPAPKEDESK